MIRILKKINIDKEIKTRNRTVILSNGVKIPIIAYYLLILIFYNLLQQSSAHLDIRNVQFSCRIHSVGRHSVGRWVRYV